MYITKLEFNNLIQSPHNKINAINFAQIKELQNKFPYCELIHNLSLLKANLEQDINFTEILAQCATHSSNRKNLFQLIHPNLDLKNKSKGDNRQSHLFEEWLKDTTSLKTKATNINTIKETVENSIKDNHFLTTETLAKIYVEQGHYERAIKAYEILCLKYPKKSGFFANQITKIKNKLN